MRELRELEKKIGQKIRLYTTKEKYRNHGAADDQPLYWRKPDFIVQVLLNSSEQKYYAPDKTALLNIRDEFTNLTKLEVNLNALFEKDWLRMVCGIVCMPAVVRWSVHSVKKIKDCKDELLFLNMIKKDKEDNIDASEFEQLKELYQKENNISLDIEKAEKAHLLKLEGEKIKFYNVDYYNIIIDNWNEFLFFDFFYDNIYGAESNLIIRKEILTALHADHVKKFALTPDLADMFSAGLGTETTDAYVLTIFNNGYCSDETVDEAGAILWRQLIDAHKSMPHDQLMRLWYRKVMVKSRKHCDVYKYLIRGEMDGFNSAAVLVIMQDPDLNATPNEYRKALLDYYMSRDLSTLQYAERFRSFDFTKDCTDTHDTMRAISLVQRGSTDDYLYFEQSCRKPISYLVGQIIKSHSCEDFSTDAIQKLMKEIHKKPYLLWTLCFWIWEWRPELVPVLMPNTGITSVLFSIQKKFSITQHIFESPSEVKFQIASALFKHMLSVIQSDAQMPANQKAKIIFDCLLVTETPQYQIKGQNPKLQREIQETARKIADDVKHEFANRPNQYSLYGGHIHTENKYYPAFLKDLFALVSASTTEDKFRNGTIDFYYEKISLLLYLSGLSKDILAKDVNLKLSCYDIAKAISGCYTETISATTVMSLDYNTFQPTAVRPIFIPAWQNIESIDWGAVFLLLEAEGFSSTFLRPANLTFNDTGDEYDDYNRFIIDKLRGHLKVLMEAYKRIKTNELNLLQRGVYVKKNLAGLQDAILEIVVLYSLNDSSKHRFDIFNSIDERPSFAGRENELIPQLGELSNYFDVPSRQKFISALLGADTLVRVVKLAEAMVAEQDQKTFVERLNSMNIPEELGRIMSLNDIQFLLTGLSRYKQFQDKANEILSYWDSNIVPRELGILTNGITAATYRTKLLLAYQANDLNSVKSVPEPSKDVYVNGIRWHPRNEKDFYLALFYFNNNDPEKAYALYNDLVNRKDDDTTTVALNRFAAKLNWGAKESDETKRNILYSEALDEWDVYQQGLPSGTSLEHLADSLLYNRLFALDALERYDEFDGIYASINHIARVRPGFFEIGIKNKLKRKMTPEAAGLIKEATEFHAVKGGPVPPFIESMNDLIVEQSDPAVFNNLFNLLFRAKPELQVQYIPDSINAGNDPVSFVLNAVVGAASSMLSTINALAKVDDEDKYTDLLILALNGAIGYLHWHASNARRGYSNSILKNPGQIDFMIYAANNDEIAICEALNLKGENNYEVEKHGVKIFNYTPSKQGLFLVVYYKGPEKNFLSSWDKYKNSIQNHVEFPESYQFESESFIDLSEKHVNAAIRIGISSHGNGILLHHIFININYKVATKVQTPKKGKTVAKKLPRKC